MNIQLGGIKWEPATVDRITCVIGAAAAANIKESEARPSSECVRGAILESLSELDLLPKFDGNNHKRVQHYYDQIRYV